MAAGGASLGHRRAPGSPHRHCPLGVLVRAVARNRGDAQNAVLGGNEGLRKDRSHPGLAVALRARSAPAHPGLPSWARCGRSQRGARRTCGARSGAANRSPGRAPTEGPGRRAPIRPGRRVGSRDGRGFSNAAHSRNSRGGGSAAGPGGLDRGGVQHLLPGRAGLLRGGGRPATHRGSVPVPTGPSAGGAAVRCPVAHRRPGRDRPHGGLFCRRHQGDSAGARHARLPPGAEGDAGDLLRARGRGEGRRPSRQPARGGCRAVHLPAAWNRAGPRHRRRGTGESSRRDAPRPAARQRLPGDY